MLAITVVSAALMSAVPKGEWVQVMPNSVSSQIASDSGHTVYVLGPGLARYPDGRWETVPGLEYGGLILNSRDFWTARQEPGPGAPAPGNVRGVVNHYLNGVKTSYDTANSCLDGNLFKLLGVDAMGRVLVDQRYFFGLGGPSTGVVRFDGKTCEPVALGLHGEMGAISYARDTLGREWFSTASVSDAPYCGGIVRLDHGTLDTLATRVCAGKFVARGTELWAATNAGIWIFSDAGVRKIASLKGITFPGITDILFDSQGVLWIGTEGYDFFENNLGLIAISGQDTVIYNQGNSPFPDYYVSGLAEDPQGNIWVGTWAKGVAVFARDKTVLALRPAARLRTGPISAKAALSIDLLGRRRSPERMPFRGPRSHR